MFLQFNSLIYVYFLNKYYIFYNIRFVRIPQSPQKSIYTDKTHEGGYRKLISGSLLRVFELLKVLCLSRCICCISPYR